MQAIVGLVEGKASVVWRMLTCYSGFAEGKKEELIVRRQGSSTLLWQSEEEELCVSWTPKEMASAKHESIGEVLGGQLPILAKSAAHELAVGGPDGEALLAADCKTIAVAGPCE